MMPCALEASRYAVRLPGKLNIFNIKSTLVFQKTHIAKHVTQWLLFIYTNHTVMHRVPAFKNMETLLNMTTVTSHFLSARLKEKSLRGNKQHIC